MSGQRQATAVVLANGRKHLSKAELAHRMEQEIHAPVPEKIKIPKWLPKEYRSEFRRVAELLIALSIYAEVDADALGRYLVAQKCYELASTKLEDALMEGNLETVNEWGAVQDRYLKQARACANDLGLTITARCRLVVPQSQRSAVDSNPFDALMQRREA